MSKELEKLKSEIDQVCDEIKALPRDASTGKILVKTGNLYQRLLIYKYLSENPPREKEVIKYIEKPIPVKEVETPAQSSDQKRVPEPRLEPQPKTLTEKKLRFDLNDRLAFQRRFFGGDAKALMSAVNVLNEMPLPKAKSWAAELANEKGIDTEDEVFTRLLDVIEQSKS